MILAIVVWFLGIQNTIEVYRDNIDLKRKTDAFLVYTKNFSKEKQVYNTNLQEESEDLFSTISYLSSTNNIQLIEFNKPKSIIQNDLEILTYKFSITGSYYSQMKTLNKLEIGYTGGSVKGYKMEKQIERKTKKTLLITTIWIQSIKPYHGN